MTKEELEKEAEEWLCNNLHSASEEDFIKAMIDIAEPREKQIQIDAEQIRALQKQNGELTEQNTSLLTSVENLNKSVQELEQKLEQTEKDLADYQFNYPTIKELEQENAELKAKKGCETCTKFDEVKLTKANELLKGMTSAYSLLVKEVGVAIYPPDVYFEAKKFLSEVEK
jgi:predicted RNase H-like nuclease (RuvC/YqgF family)